MNKPASTTSGRRYLAEASLFSHSDTTSRTSSSERRGRIREMRRELGRKVLSDWKFNYSDVEASGLNKGRDDSSVVVVAGEADPDDNSKMEWRERDYSSRSSSSPTPSLRHLRIAATEEIHVERRGHRRLLEEEMSWNAGLRHWMAQRDAWTGARLRRRRRRVCSHHPSGSSPVTSAGADEDGTSPIIDEGHRSNNNNNEPSESTSSSSDDNEVEDVDIIEEVPIPPPLLSISARVRDSMTPELHSQIYSKVVVRGMTPLAPLNLADLTNAIVAGWKADGQWPPKTTTVVDQQQQQERQQQQHPLKTVSRKAWPGPIEKLAVRIAAGRGDLKGGREKKAGTETKGGGGK